MRSIGLKNFTAMAATVLSCFMMVVFSLLCLGRVYIIRDFKQDMIASAEEVSHIAAAISITDSLDSWLLNMSVSAISNSTGNHVVLTDPSGVILSCSDRSPMCRHIGLHLSDSLMQGMISGEISQPTDMEGLYAESRYVISRAINSELDGSVKGYVIVSNTAAEMQGDWSTFLMMVSAVCVVVIMFSLVFSFAYSKRMARPLDEIAAASRKFARGDFSVRVRQVDDPEDEMGALIDSFNKMADSLEKADARRSEFIANVSHELRTPMTTIAGFADGILDGTIPQEESAKYLVSIRDETRRLSRLVRDMLDVSQMKSGVMDTGKYSKFDLVELVLQTLLSFEARATKKNLDVDPQLPENNMMVFADKDAITRVIYNLLDNAVKFAKPGSCLTIRVYKEGEKAYFSVKDEGETIPPDDLPFIFDRFHKSDRSRSMDKDGVGLGLYLVKTIINSHDEDIAVKSEDGMTEFVFTLKLADK
ncbi:MAG: HAMP domain-containing histidine kinase [Oscillospiraceae bacterium]|nr:HAMP domain-containing histidine kinase [Oscillospiraceae bacterium]